MNEILERLGLGQTNPGSWSGAKAYESDDASLIDSVNPASGEIIASVRSTTPDEYDRIVNNARSAFLDWRKVP
ncbi:MAG: aldehyde dehydrogenase family protein, partial [Woeseiaceae bacterium]